MRLRWLRGILVLAAMVVMWLVIVLWATMLASVLGEGCAAYV